MKQMPMIEKYMTAMPHTINSSMPVKIATKMMTENRFRHLPVQDNGKLVGVLTDRDIKLAGCFEDQEKMTVNDIMTQDPYTTTPQASLDQVVFEMAEHKYGCAVIQQANGKIVGIFTATDGLRVLGEVLQTHFKAIQS